MFPFCRSVLLGPAGPCRKNKVKSPNSHTENARPTADEPEALQQDSCWRYDADTTSAGSQIKRIKLEGIAYVILTTLHYEMTRQPSPASVAPVALITPMGLWHQNRSQTRVKF